MKKALIGYQVYSAREEAAKDLKGVLKKLAELGYDGVEFAGFYGHTAQEVKAMLEETSLCLKWLRAPGQEAEWAFVRRSAQAAFARITDEIAMN